MWRYWRSYQRRLRVAAWREIKRRAGAVARVQAAYRGRRLRERELPDVVAELRNTLFYVRHFRRQEARRAAVLRLQAWGRGWHGRQQAWAAWEETGQRRADEGLAAALLTRVARGMAGRGRARAARRVRDRELRHVMAYAGLVQRAYRRARARLHARRAQRLWGRALRHLDLQARRDTANGSDRRHHTPPARHVVIARVADNRAPFFLLLFARRP